MTLILKDDNGNLLPQDVQDRVNTFIDNLKNVPFFKPDKDLKKEDVEKQAKFTLECFGVEATVEYRPLRTQKDWEVARDVAWDAVRYAALDAAWGAARGAARYAARDVAWDAAWDAAWGAARGAARYTAGDAAGYAARDAARGAAEILIQDKISDKYPNGAFKQLFKLWEMGLYPVGILDETKTFVIYVPHCSAELPDDFK